MLGLLQPMHWQRRELIIVKSKKCRNVKRVCLIERPRVGIRCANDALFQSFLGGEEVVLVFLHGCVVA